MSCRVVSVSLGPRTRDRAFGVAFDGACVEVQRLGCDGDEARAAALIRALDGKVAAIGLGGANFAYRYDGCSWPIPVASRLRRLARRTPVVDGSLFKDFVEAEVVRRRLRPAKAEELALVVSALDRPRHVQVLRQLGYRVRVGDPHFALGLPWWPSPEWFARWCRLTMPALRHLALRRVYEGYVGQLRPPTRCSHAFSIVWGDVRLFLRRPVPLKNATFVTSSIRREDVHWLKRLGMQAIVPVAPAPRGDEAFGANVWEAILVALCGHVPDGLQLLRLFDEVHARARLRASFDAPMPYR